MKKKEKSELRKNARAHKEAKERAYAEGLCGIQAQERLAAVGEPEFSSVVLVGGPSVLDTMKALDDNKRKLGYTYGHRGDMKLMLRLKVAEMLEEYINESEHGDGEEYWDQFKKVEEVVSDFLLLYTELEPPDEVLPGEEVVEEPKKPVKQDATNNDWLMIVRNNATPKLYREICNLYNQDPPTARARWDKHLQIDRTK